MKLLSDPLHVRLALAVSSYANSRKVKIICAVEHKGNDKTSSASSSANFINKQKSLNYRTRRGNSPTAGVCRYILATMSIRAKSLLKLIPFVATSHAFNLAACLSRSATLTRDCDKFLSSFFKPLRKNLQQNMCTCTINGDAARCTLSGSLET